LFIEHRKKLKGGSYLSLPSFQQLVALPVAFSKKWENLHARILPLAIVERRPKQDKPRITFHFWLLIDRRFELIFQQHTNGALPTGGGLVMGG
jgi:hypothetical protein